MSWTIRIFPVSALKQALITRAPLRASGRAASTVPAVPRTVVRANVAREREARARGRGCGTSTL
jgi:hypothetical protein